MARTALVAFAAAAAGVIVTLVAVGGTAHADGTKVTCTQVPQKPGQVDEVYISNFMSQSLADGHNHFTSITGASTVLCAY